MAEDTIMWIGAGVLALLISGALLWLIGLTLPATPGPGADAPLLHKQDVTFWFRDEILLDHDAGAGLNTAIPTDWAGLCDWLNHRFGPLPAMLIDTDLPDRGEHVFHATGPTDAARLVVTRDRDLLRVVLSDPDTEQFGPAQRHALIAAGERLRDTSGALERAPYPIWKTGDDGALIWQNSASAAAWADGQPPKIEPAEHEDTSPNRIAREDPDTGTTTWYEVRSIPANGAMLHHASDISKVIRAETAQREFVQTLTKTFAHLTVGLAVFDSNRQLALFNPALVDLTSLPVEFLSVRPDLMGFFDKLRDRQVMPEPRSYASWRAQINEMITAARGGHYQETWSLPTDVTYRVTGRPHPDGAVAFFFEDISAEIMLARRFRSQLDLRQSALDRLPEAVIAIGPNNVLSFCNSACTQILGIDPDTSFADMSVADLLAACNAVLPGKTFWDSVELSLQQRAATGSLHKSAVMDNGAMLDCHIEPLGGGARMLRLHINARLPHQKQQVTQPTPTKA